MAKSKRKIVLIAHNIRSAHNIGALLRTAEGLGLNDVYLTGYSPYPELSNDTRLPHMIRKISAQIHKTALGTEAMLKCYHSESINPVINKLRRNDFQIVSLEQSPNAETLPVFKPSNKLAIIVGNEVEGLADSVLDQSDAIVQIPMLGKKESFNVAAAAAMAIYHCRFMV